MTETTAKNNRSSIYRLTGKISGTKMHERKDRNGESYSYLVGKFTFTQRNNEVKSVAVMIGSKVLAKHYPNGFRNGETVSIAGTFQNLPDKGDMTDRQSFRVIGPAHEKRDAAAAEVAAVETEEALEAA